MDSVRVVIVDDCEETRNNIKTLLSFNQSVEVVGEAGDGETAVEVVKEIRPDVVLMDINMPGSDGIYAAGEISVNVPESAVIIMSVQGEQEYLKKAMTAGARDFIIKPFSEEELLQTIQKVFEIEQKRREHSLNLDREPVKSNVITVFGTKGGVGKTTLAVNLAVSLAKHTKKKTALLDMDLQFGNAAVMLNVTVKNTISDLVKDINQVDKNSINDYLITHFSGVRLLAAPVKPEYAEYITSMHVEKIISLLKESYHYIIIDTLVGFGESVLTSLDMSNTIVYTAVPDIPTIKNLKSGFDVMESLHYPQDKIKIILNKASEQYGIKYKDFEEAIKRPIWAYIPEDAQTAVYSANKGLPFVMMRTETKISKAVLDITKKITGSPQKSIKDRAFLEKLFGM